MSITKKAKALVRALTDLQDHNIYLSRNANLALQDLQDEFQKTCGDFGRCSCLKGYCDKGYKN